MVSTSWNREVDVLFLVQKDGWVFASSRSSEFLDVMML